MANQLQKGRLFNPGDTVQAADLNNLVDLAIALPAIITGQGTPVNATTGDKALVVRTGALKQADISTFPQGVTSVGLTVTPTTVLQVITTGPNPIVGAGSHEVHIKDQGGNKFLASPVDGTTGPPAFRAVNPADTIMYVEVGALTINCALGNVFRKILPGTAVNNALHLNNGALGQRITIYLIQNANPGATTVTWTTDDAGPPPGVIRWPGGVDHTMTTGSIGRTDIVNFLCMGSGLYYGTYNKDFTP